MTGHGQKNASKNGDDWVTGGWFMIALATFGVGLPRFPMVFHGFPTETRRAILRSPALGSVPALRRLELVR